mgnify:CR=1 FL=1
MQPVVVAVDVVVVGSVSFLVVVVSKMIVFSLDLIQGWENTGSN